MKKRESVFYKVKPCVLSENTELESWLPQNIFFLPFSYGIIQKCFLTYRFIMLSAYSVTVVGSVGTYPHPCSNNISSSPSRGFQDLCWHCIAWSCPTDRSQLDRRWPAKPNLADPFLSPGSLEYEPKESWVKLVGGCSWSMEIWISGQLHFADYVPQRTEKCVCWEQ